MVNLTRGDFIVVVFTSVCLVPLLEIAVIGIVWGIKRYRRRGYQPIPDDRNGGGGNGGGGNGGNGGEGNGGYGEGGNGRGGEGGNGGSIN